MARFRATIEAQAWKELTCVACACVYRYLARRKVVGRGPTPDIAEADAHASAPRVLALAADLEPCPGCGLYQPDMVGARRLRRHGVILGIAGLLLLIVPCASLALAPGMGALLPGAVLAAAAGLAHFLVCRWDPNRDLDANRRQAQALLTAGHLTLVKEGAPSAEAPPRAGRAAPWAAGLLLGVSLAAYLTPEGQRLLAGAPLNPGFEPPVAGPGDKVTVDFPDRFFSAGGHWNGQATVHVLNAHEAGRPAGFTLPAASRSDEWGESIRVKGYANKQTNLWASFTLPDDSALAAKSLQLRIELSVRFPTVKTEGTAVFANAQNTGFVEETRSFSRTLTLTTAAVPRVGETYQSLRLTGFVVGFLAYLVAGSILAISAALFKQRAIPSKLHLPDLG